MKMDGEALNTSCRGIGETLMVPLGVTVQKVLESLMAKRAYQKVPAAAQVFSSFWRKRPSFAENKNRIIQEIVQFFNSSHEKG